MPNLDNSQTLPLELESVTEGRSWISLEDVRDFLNDETNDSNKRNTVNANLGIAYDYIINKTIQNKRMGLILSFCLDKTKTAATDIDAVLPLINTNILADVRHVVACFATICRHPKASASHFDFILDQINAENLPGELDRGRIFAGICLHAIATPVQLTNLLPQINAEHIPLLEVRENILTTAIEKAKNGTEAADRWPLLLAVAKHPEATIGHLDDIVQQIKEDKEDKEDKVPETENLAPILIAIAGHPRVSVQHFDLILDLIEQEKVPVESDLASILLNLAEHPETTADHLAAIVQQIKEGKIPNTENLESILIAVARHAHTRFENLNDLYMQLAADKNISSGLRVDILQAMAGSPQAIPALFDSILQQQIDRDDFSEADEARILLAIANHPQANATQLCTIVQLPHPTDWNRNDISSIITAVLASAANLTETSDQADVFAAVARRREVTAEQLTNIFQRAQADDVPEAKQADIFTAIASKPKATIEQISYIFQQVIDNNVPEEKRLDILLAIAGNTQATNEQVAQIFQQVTNNTLPEEKRTDFLLAIADNLKASNDQFSHIFQQVIDNNVPEEKRLDFLLALASNSNATGDLLNQILDHAKDDDVKETKVAIFTALARNPRASVAVRDYLLQRVSDTDLFSEMDRATILLSIIVSPHVTSANLLTIIREVDPASFPDLSSWLHVVGARIPLHALADAEHLDAILDIMIAENWPKAISRHFALYFIANNLHANTAHFAKILQIATIENLSVNHLLMVLDAVAKRPRVTEEQLDEIFAKTIRDLPPAQQANALTSITSNSQTTAKQLSKILEHLLSTSNIPISNLREVLSNIARHKKANADHLQDVLKLATAENFANPSNLAAILCAVAKNLQATTEWLNHILQQANPQNFPASFDRVPILVAIARHPRATANLLSHVLEKINPQDFPEPLHRGSILVAIVENPQVDVECFNDILPLVNINDLASAFHRARILTAIAGNTRATNSQINRVFQQVNAENLLDPLLRGSILAAIVGNLQVDIERFNDILPLVNAENLPNALDRARILAALGGNPRTTTDQRRDVLRQVDPQNFPDPFHRASILTAIAGNSALIATEIDDVLGRFNSQNIPNPRDRFRILMALAKNSQLTLVHLDNLAQKINDQNVPNVWDRARIFSTIFRHPNADNDMRLIAERRYIDERESADREKSYGAFTSLPTEKNIEIMTYMSLDDIRNFSRTNWNNRAIVEIYRNEVYGNVIAAIDLSQRLDYILAFVKQAEIITAPEIDGLLPVISAKHLPRAVDRFDIFLVIAALPQAVEAIGDIVWQVNPTNLPDSMNREDILAAVVSNTAATSKHFVMVTQHNDVTAEILGAILEKIGALPIQGNKRDVLAAIADCPHATAEQLAAVDQHRIGALVDNISQRYGQNVRQEAISDYLKNITRTKIKEHYDQMFLGGENFSNLLRDGLVANLNSQPQENVLTPDAINAFRGLSNLQRNDIENGIVDKYMNAIKAKPFSQVALLRSCANKPPYAVLEYIKKKNPAAIEFRHIQEWQRHYMVQRYQEIKDTLSSTITTPNADPKQREKKLDTLFNTILNHTNHITLSEWLSQSNDEFIGSIKGAVERFRTPERSSRTGPESGRGTSVSRVSNRGRGK